MSDSPQLLPVADLPPDHLAPVKQAISRLFSSDLGFITFAQIADGCPIQSTYQEYYGHFRADFENNREPSPDAKRVIRELQQTFLVEDLQLEANALQAYQNASISSPEFTLRLMEIVIIAVHEVAVRVFRHVDGGLNKPGEYRIPPTDLGNGEFFHHPVPHHPTELFLWGYECWEQYPNGVADIVGYWAELQLFGGVVLFDRGESGTECKDVFVHPPGRWLIFQLSETQKQRFADLALATHPKPGEALDWKRFKGQKKTRRVDPYDAMSLHIYRNTYERIIPSRRPRRDVIHAEDLPDFDGERSE